MAPETLATGQQLARRLESWIPQLVGGSIPRAVGAEIRQGLDAADLQLRRQATLRAILGVIDPDGGMSLWHAAKAMADALTRLDGVALRRIQSGHRLPTRIESLLMEWLILSPVRCQEKLYQELKRLGR